MKVNILVSLILWLLYGIGFAVALPFAVLSYLISPFDRHRLVANRIFMLAGRALIFWNPFWKVNYLGLENYKNGDRVIFIGNHRSFLDMPLLASLPWNMKWVSKEGIFKIPVVGWLMRWAGHVMVLRGSNAAARALLKLKPYVESAVPVMIFPEGTRSVTGKLLPFKPGAFQLALNTNSSIIPVVTFGTHEILKPSDWKMARRGTMYISVLQPLSQNEFSNVESFQSEAYTRISDEFQRLKKLYHAALN